jgi:hypothetical protein
MVGVELGQVIGVDGGPCRRRRRLNRGTRQAVHRLRALKRDMGALPGGKTSRNCLRLDPGCAAAVE